MPSKCPEIDNANIMCKAKKMELDAAIERVKLLRKEHKKCVEALKVLKERLKSGKAKPIQKYYADNYYNRSQNRVGKPIPRRGNAASASASSDGAAAPASTDGVVADASKEAKATTKLYKDNAYNRAKKRVGLPHAPRNGKKKKKQQQEEEESKAEVVVESPKAQVKTGDDEEVDAVSDSIFSDSDSEGF